MVALVFAMRKLGEVGAVWVAYVICCLVGEMATVWDTSPIDNVIIYLVIPLIGFFIALLVLLVTMLTIGIAVIICKSIIEAVNAVGVKFFTAILTRRGLIATALSVSTLGLYVNIGKYVDFWTCMVYIVLALALAFVVLFCVCCVFYEIIMANLRGARKTVALMNK